MFHQPLLLKQCTPFNQLEYIPVKRHRLRFTSTIQAAAKTETHTSDNDDHRHDKSSQNHKSNKTIPSKEPGRREIILASVNLAILGDAAVQVDGRTVVNSILGAYGLPQIKQAAGFRAYDDFDLDYVFEYPKSWVSRKNTLRSGIYISDFNTADKLTTESFSLPSNVADDQALAELVVSEILNPSGSGPEIGGDSKLEMPPSRKIKTESIELDGQKYLYIAFPSSTTTRSGYDVKRKNLAVAAIKKGSSRVYALCVSVRNDQWNPEKQQLMEYVVNSFRLR